MLPGNRWGTNRRKKYQTLVKHKGVGGDNIGMLLDNVKLESLPENAPIPNPEPATMLLLGSGLAGLAGFRRKFKKH
jgi:hypothetical protein